MSNRDGKYWGPVIVLSIVVAGLGGYEVGKESDAHLHDETVITQEYKDSVLQELGSFDSACTIIEPLGDQRKIIVKVHKSDPAGATVFVMAAGSTPKIVQCPGSQWDIVRHIGIGWIAKRNDGQALGENAVPNSSKPAPVPPPALLSATVHHAGNTPVLK